jgi:glutamate synthase (NADPH/NADH) small chain
MEYLPGANRVQEGDLEKAPIDVCGAHVVILGGGDTGADCLGTTHRQGAASVTQLEIMPRPPELRPDTQPWPTYPMTYKVTSAHEEGGDRVYAVSTSHFVAGPDGRVSALSLVEVEMVDGRFTPVADSEREIPCDYAFLAMGFTGPEQGPLLDQLGVELDERGNISRDEQFQSSVHGVFACGDAGRGQSLIVWAIAEGRSAAAEVDRWLTGRTSLPAPIPPTAGPITA